MIPHTNADQEIAIELLRIDRSLWATLNKIKKSCNELYIKHLFNKSAFSGYVLETILEIEKEQGDIANEHRTTESPKDKFILNWLGERPSIQN